MPKNVQSVHTPETLGEIAGLLKGAMDEVNKRKADMRLYSLSTMTVEAGHPELEKALDRIRTFLVYVDNAIFKAKKTRGDFGKRLDSSASPEPPNDGIGLRRLDVNPEPTEPAPLEPRPRRRINRKGQEP